MKLGYPETELVERAFTTALLLTGSAGHAEAAVMEGICSQHGKLSAESVLHATVNASIRVEPEEDESASSLLPKELRPVLRLPARSRHCYVLRILVGYSREVCASLLKTGMHNIDDAVCGSVWNLSGQTADLELAGTASV